MDNPPRTVDAARSVSVRRIDRSDAQPLRAFYAGLSVESRRRRFLGTAHGISAEQAERFANELGVVAVLRERGAHDGAIVGHACLPLVEPGLAEVAIAVADGCQGRGIGGALLRAAIGVARSAGVRRLTASMFVDNAAMHRLLLATGLPPRRLNAAGGVDGLVMEIDGAPPVASDGVPNGTSRNRERPAQTGRSAHLARPAAAVG